MHSKTCFVFLLLLSVSCNTNSSANKKTVTPTTTTANKTISNPYASIAAIPLPSGFQRMQYDSNTFGNWLQQVPLKKGETVYLYNGEKKKNQSAQFAVLDISTGTQNLQQCADAVMRLRAEYLFASNQADHILFTDNDGTRYQFTAPFTTTHLHQYLQTVFGMCGSASLEKQLKPINNNNIQTGDVLIRGGFPGHAVIVMDMAKNKDGKKIYLLAQSYMPAQDIHVLKNPADENLSPWYEVNDANTIYTPEYVFNVREWRTW